MKRIFCMLLVAVMLCMTLCACNTGVGFGNYTFRHVAFAVGNEVRCANVDIWYDNELGCEVKTGEYGFIYLTEGSYILIESGDRCPYCGG